MGGTPGPQQIGEATPSGGHTVTVHSRRATDPVPDLALNKYASSGLTQTDAAQLGMEYVDLASTLGEGFAALPAIVIPYFTVTGEPREFMPGWGPYFRTRYLATPPGTGFEGQQKDTKLKKPPKYMQPADSGLAAYFPRIDGCDWPDIVEDPTQAIIITEGEFKAAKACKEGFPTIGLGGIYSYQSTRYGFDMLPELKSVVWPRRRVMIIYDSDLATNEHVQDALNRLAEVLMLKGALPYAVIMPKIDDGKTGIDDFLLARGAEAFAELIDEYAKPLTLSAPLWEINKELVYIANPGVVMVRATGQKLSPNAFKEHSDAATKVLAEQSMGPNAKISMRSVSAAAAWLTWPMRMSANKLTYAPGRPKIINPDSKYESAWNNWPGWGIQAEPGDAQPFLDLVDHLFTGADPKIKQWFLQWCAYPLQYPGTKLFTSVLLWGVNHGTGKSLIGYTLGKIYGRNFTELNQKDLYDGFNEWAENIQLAMGDDVTGSDKRHDSDRLKKFITQKELRLNIKHVQSFTVPDCINYFFTANGPTALFLEDNDRRSFVHEVTVQPLDEGFYMDYDLWLSTGGAAAVFDYLLKLDTGNFNPAGRALYTEAKGRMIADARSDLAEWVSRLLESPEDLLRVGQVLLTKDLFTNRDLLALYDADGRTKTTANGMGRELRRVGVTYALDGRLIRPKGGAQDRYYVVRNAKQWAAATMEDFVAHLSDEASKKRAVKF